MPPPGMPFKTTEKKLDYFNEVIGNFVDEYVAVDPDKENNNSERAVDDDDDQTDRVRLVYTIYITIVIVGHTYVFDNTQQH